MFYRKLITICFVFCIIASINTTLNIVDAKVQKGNFSGGDGTLFNPYHIENIYDLQNIKSFEILSKFYIIC